MPGHVAWKPGTSEVKDPGFMPSFNDVRWFGRHPNRTVTRTCSADRIMKVGMLVMKLFPGSPDLHGNTPWTMFHGDVVVESDSQVNKYESLTIQWNGARPFPVTALAQVRWTQEIDTPTVQAKIQEDFQRLAIRSPFKVRVQEMKCPASFMIMSRVQTSLICSQNAVVVNPCLMVQDVCPEHVVDIRICPMLGGGKGGGKNGTHDKTEVMKSKLKAMLVERGVPEGVVGERVTDIFSKIPHDKLADLGDVQSPNTWKALKDMASDAKLRLI